MPSRSAPPEDGASKRGVSTTQSPAFGCATSAHRHAQALPICEQCSTTQREDQTACPGCGREQRVCTQCMLALPSKDFRSDPRAWDTLPCRFHVGLWCPIRPVRHISITRGPPKALTHKQRPLLVESLPKPLDRTWRDAVHPLRKPIVSAPRRPPPRPPKSIAIDGGKLAYEVAAKGSPPPTAPPTPKPPVPSPQELPRAASPSSAPRSSGRKKSIGFLNGAVIDERHRERLVNANNKGSAGIGGGRRRSQVGDVGRAQLQQRRPPPPPPPPPGQVPDLITPSPPLTPGPGEVVVAVQPPATALPEPLAQAPSRPSRPARAGGAPEDTTPAPAPEFDPPPPLEVQPSTLTPPPPPPVVDSVLPEPPPAPTAPKPPPKPRMRKLPNDDTGVEIIFQDASAMDPGSNTQPHDANRTYRSAAIPPNLSFIVHLKTWRMATSLSADVRSKVQVITTLHELDSLTVARYSLRLNDVIGLRTHPVSAVVRKLTAGRSGSYPGANHATEVLPTLVVHVPSQLNPGYLDAMIEFSPKTASSQHRPQDKPEDREAARPRIIVPLHLARDHPAKVLSVRNPGPKKLLARLAQMPARGTENEDSPRRTDGIPIEQRAAGAAAELDTARARSWTQGWLPFPLHDQSVEQSAAAAQRQARMLKDQDGVRGGWRRFLRKDNGEGGEPVSSVDERPILEPSGVVGGLAGPPSPPPPSSSPASSKGKARKSQKVRSAEAALEKALAAAL